MEKKLLAHVYKIIFECPQRKAGEMICIEQQKLIYSFGQPGASNRPQAHRCSLCGYIQGLPYPYPYLRIDNIETEGFQVITKEEGNA